MAGKDLKFTIDADVKKAVKGLSDVAKQARETGEDLEGLESPGKAAAKAMADAADEMILELERTQETADMLATHLGDVADKLDVNKAVNDLRKMGLSFEDIEAEADELSAAIKKMDTALSGLDASRSHVDDVGNSMRRVGDEADNSRSVMANFAGNAASELPGVTGAFGPLNMAIGQFTEYAAEGNINMRGLTSVVGPMAGIAAATFLATKAYEGLTKANNLTKKTTEEVGAALRENLGIIDQIEEAAGAAEGAAGDIGKAFQSTMDEGNIERTSGALAGLGKTWEEFGQIMIDMDRDAEGTMQRLAELAGVVPEVAAEIANVVQEYNSWDEIEDQLVNNGWSDKKIAQYEGVIKALEELDDQSENLNTEEAAQAFLNDAASSDEYTRSLVEQAEAAAKAKDENAGAVAILDELSGLLTQAATAAEDAVPIHERYTAVQEEANAALAEQAQSARDAASAEQERINVMRAGADATFALQEAQDTFTDTVQGLSEKVDAAAGDQEELNRVYRQAAQDGLAVADATVRLAEEQGKQMGVTLNAKDSLDLWNRSAINQAAQLNGPARDALIAYIAQVNGIPESEVTAIFADLDEVGVETANGRLNDASRARTAAISADAHTADAEAELNQVARSRDAIIRAVGRLGAGFNAKGTDYWRGGLTWVGEEGPELIDLQRGARVIPAPESAQIARSAATMATSSAGPAAFNAPFSVTINMPPGSDGDSVIAAIKKFESRNGPGWRK